MPTEASRLPHRWVPTARSSWSTPAPPEAWQATPRRLPTQHRLIWAPRFPETSRFPNDIYISNDISLCFHSTIKLTVNASVRSHPLFSANYSPSPGGRPLQLQCRKQMAYLSSRTASAKQAGARGTQPRPGGAREGTHMRRTAYRPGPKPSAGCSGTGVPGGKGAEKPPLSPTPWDPPSSLQGEAQLHAAVGSRSPREALQHLCFLL